MLPQQLRSRKANLQYALNKLSGSPEVVPCDALTLPDGVPVVRMRHNIRISRAKLRLYIWEEFRDLDADPTLYAFSYHIAEESDVNIERPLFRYECHPEVGDKSTESDSVAERAPFRSPYEREPHFHPDSTTGECIRKLHFPFHRAERKGVVFALVEWLLVDLIRRFHHLPTQQQSRV